MRYQRSGTQEWMQDGAPDEIRTHIDSVTAYGVGGRAGTGAGCQEPRAEACGTLLGFAQSVSRSACTALDTPPDGRNEVPPGVEPGWMGLQSITSPLGQGTNVVTFSGLRVTGVESPGIEPGSRVRMIRLRYGNATDPVAGYFEPPLEGLPPHLGPERGNRYCSDVFCCPVVVSRAYPLREGWWSLTSDQRGSVERSESDLRVAVCISWALIFLRCVENPPCRPSLDFVYRSIACRPHCVASAARYFPGKCPPCWR